MATNKHQKFQSKNVFIFLNLIILFLFYKPLYSQEDTLTCGVYTKQFNNEPGQGYIDRFQNNYSLQELTIDQTNSEELTTCTSGYYKLFFEGNFTSSEQITICSTFYYLSGLITPKNGDALINIYLTKGYFQDNYSLLTKQILAVASGYYEDNCGMAKSLVEEAILSDNPNNYMKHGYIMYNQLIDNWHTIDNDGPGGAVAGYDLFSVTLHEALHTLGFASLMFNVFDQLVYSNKYSIYDKFLYTEYDTLNKFFLKPAVEDIMCCDQRTPNITDYTFIDNKNVNTICDSKIFFYDGGGLKVPVGGIGIAVPVRGNIVSHLNNNCTMVNPHYVMHPTLAINTKVREVSQDEKDILCRMGFPIDTSCTNCDPVLVEDDGVFTIPLNDTLVLTSDDFLNNDVLPSGYHAYTVFYTICGEHDGLNIVSNGNPFDPTFTVIATAPGYYCFCYTVAANCSGGECEDGSICIYVPHPDIPDCCGSTCDLLCNGSFESVTSNDDLNIKHAKGTAYGVNTFYFGAPTNIPTWIHGYKDVSCIGNPSLYIGPSDGNNMVQLLTNSPNSGTPYKSGVYFPFCSSIPPGGSAEIEFDALAFEACSGTTFTPKLRLDFSTGFPVGNVDVYTTPGTTGNYYEVTLPFANSTTYSSLHHFTVPVTNNTDEDWNYIYISHVVSTMLTSYRSWALLDNVKVENDPNKFPYTVKINDIVPYTPCPFGKMSVIYEICNPSSAIPSEELSFDLTVPAGLSLLPNDFFPSTSFTLPAGAIAPGECINLEAVFDVTDDDMYFEVPQHIILFVNTLDSCKNGITIDTFINIVPTPPITIEKTNLGQNLDTGDPEYGWYTFKIKICNTSDFFENHIKILDQVSDYLKITDTGPFNEILHGLYLNTTLDAMTCDSFYWKGTPVCICFQDSIDNCAIVRIDQSGCWDNASCVPSFFDQRTGPIPTPEFTYVDHNCGLVCFDWMLNMCDGCQSNLWLFGDGHSSVNIYPCHTYAATGTYTVTHITYNLCGSDTASTPIHVYVPVPNAGFDYELDGCTFVFTSDSETGNHSWDFGDGTTSTDINPTHLYETNGTYTVIHGNQLDDCPWVYDTIIVIDSCPDRLCDKYGNFDFAIHYATDPGCVTNTSSLGISSITGQNITIDGMFVVNSEFSFINCIIKMGPKAMIQINKNHKLTIDSTKIFACENLWTGIRVGNGGLLTIQHHSHIEDAYYAIDLDGIGDLLEVTNTRFNRNLVGIMVNKNGLFGTHVLPVSFYGNVFDCTLPLNSNGGEVCEYLAPSPGDYNVSYSPWSFACVIGYQTTLTNFCKVGTIATNEVNIYNHHKYGYLLINSGLRALMNSEFRNIPPTDLDDTYDEGFAILGSSDGTKIISIGLYPDISRNTKFINCQNGIFVNDYELNQFRSCYFNNVMNGINIRNLIPIADIEIIKSTLNTSRDGIVINNYVPNIKLDVHEDTISNSGYYFYGYALALQEMGQSNKSLVGRNIRNNEISAHDSPNCVLLSNVNGLNFKENNISIPGASVASAVEITNCTKLDVRDNHISGNSISAYGIFELLSIDAGNDGIYGDMNYNNNYTCNFIHDLRSGMQFNNMNDKSLLAENTFSEDPSVSDGYDFKYGIHLNENGVIGTQYNNFNKWPGSSSSIDELIHDSGLPKVYTKSEFLIDNGLASDYKPSPYTPSGLVTLGTYSSGDGCDAPPPGTPFISRMDSSLVRDSFPFNDTLSFRWYSDNNLIRLVNGSRDTVSFDSDVLDYVDSLTSALNGSYIYVSNELNTILSYSPYKTHITGAKLRIDTIIATLHTTGQTLTSLSNSTLRSAYNYYVDSLLTVLHDLDSTLLTYVIATHNYRFNALDTLQTFNSGLSYPKDYILNEKRINEYIMDLYIRDSLYLTSPEMDDVRDIADQCPDEGGSSVYRARAIRSLFEEANYLFNCSTVSLPILHTYNQKLTDLLMFPNPASDELTFLRKGNDEDLEINLLNINGSIISKWKLLKENTQMTVSLANIPAGVYIAKGISVDGRFISGMKLIVIKN